VSADVVYPDFAANAERRYQAGLLLLNALLSGYELDAEGTAKAQCAQMTQQRRFNQGQPQAARRGNRDTQGRQ
jgi:hypothetical protein